MADGESIISIRERLLKERNALLDLSTRNRLLNTPLRVRNNRSIEIVDEKSTEVLRLLDEGKSLIFAAGLQLGAQGATELEPDEFDTDDSPQRAGDAIENQGVALRHTDLKLQTRLTGEGLQKRLFDIWYDAHTLEDEQGVNILYLAVGLLRWFDSPSSEIARHAPLVLVPVQLDRSSAADRFKLKRRHEPPSPNLTLQAKLKIEFGLILDDFQDEDALDLPAYFARAVETVSGQARWEVLPDSMVLGFFSFAKFLMYRDLDPDHWPSATGIDQHPLVSALLRDGFPESEALVPSDTSPIDDVVTPLALNHVVDADSSQAIAIAEAAGGRTLVVKGPPGTGKSQTITNIIAAAAAQGKKVLFVAEKMAALDVVHRRLRQTGLGPLTLELHSNKANKRALLEELKRTKEASIRPPRNDVGVIEELGAARRELNGFAARLHTPLQPCGLTPREIVGRLMRLGSTPERSVYALEEATAWRPADVEQRRRLVSDIADRLVTLGAPSQHPWCGVRCEALGPDDVEVIVRCIETIRAALAESIASIKSGDGLLAAPLLTIQDIVQATRVLGAAASLPETADRRALSHPAWHNNRAGLAHLITAGEARAATSAAIGVRLSAAVWPVALSAVRIAVVTKGARLFRFLDSDYKSMIALLQSYVGEPLPKSVAARAALIDRIIEAQAARQTFDRAKELAAAFGDAWNDAESNWASLRTWLNWANENALPAECLSRLAEISDMQPVKLAAARSAKSVAALTDGLATLVRMLDLDIRRSLSAQSLDSISIERLASRIDAWLANPEGVTRFIAFASRGREAASLGLTNLIEAVHDGFVDAKALASAFERAYAETLKSVLFGEWPELKAFDGETLDHMVAEFQRLDRARIDLAKEQIVNRHAEERPKGLAGVGPLGILNAELAKRRKFLPIRVLLEKAGPAIQQLKPVFMMSPLSVAQYLKPGGLSFDLMVMDEASQIEPVDALGAVARAKQIVIVGDERQLPPTAFFKKLTGDGDGDEEDDDGVTIQAKDAESILDLCLAKGAPHRMLNWHYRSKHQSLIAVSNKEFYENKLFIVPSPYDAIGGMGLKFHLLKDAPYDRGGTRTNPTEARVVAEAVMRHARETPEQSLGVATFSVAQRQIVLKELEILRRVNPDLEEFFSRSAAEPFFVKNLENIQGDERDVIYISIGYGKTEQGYLAHNFGPLSGEGGERRLNVLISRAKLRCDVFCNFTGADIDPERSRARGVMALKMFLTFAETGKFGLGEEIGLDHDSDFEAEVAERLRTLGYDVRAQIGASGFRVDLAISDPDKPGRFVLGIECDGAQYHSSRSARDRDRLRQQVLEAHGWIVHRIWSADWYLRPNEELRKVEKAIASARAEWRERDDEGFARAQAAPLSLEGSFSEGEIAAGIASVLETPSVAPASPTIPPYIEAQFTVNTATDPHEAPLADMADYVVKVVEIEGPVHIDEIATRIRTLWGLHKAGSRIRTAVAAAAKVAAMRGLIVGGPFFTSPGQPVVVRNRSTVSSSGLRHPDMLPPSEVEAALRAVVRENYGAAKDELILAVARTFGYAVTSAQLRNRLAEGIARLLESGALAEKDGLLFVPDAH